MAHRRREKFAALLALTTFVAGAGGAAAQEAPSPAMFTVVDDPAEPGPRITPYLLDQLDGAWRQDDARRAAFEKIRTEADLLALRK
ncbi:MAG TPA: hypothetical protein VIK51_12315, partial [Vicinamibacteria bacterium]